MDEIERIRGENEGEKEEGKKAHPDDYGRSVSKIAVSQVCESIGFDSARESSLEALSNVAVRYICDLGKSACLYANLAGRTQCNVFDIFKGLHDIASTSGLVSRAAAFHVSPLVDKLVDFVGSVDDIPFAQPIPRFPVVKYQRLIPSFHQMDETVNVKYVPEWLPAFPDPHTYSKSPVWSRKKNDLRIDKGEQARQRRKAERSLLNLQQRLLYSGLASSGPQHCRAVDSGRETGAGVSEDNPFLAPALPAGENRVSQVPSRRQFTNVDDMKHLSVQEAFSPVIDALKGGGKHPLDVDWRVVSESRPTVHFKLKAGKKLLVEDLDVNLKIRSNGKKSTWFPREDDKDDKKRRAELILRQAIENAHEQ